MASPSAQARQRAARLRAEIAEHDRLYFVENNPRISDEAYDALVLELRQIEADFPELLTPDSPTQRVGERLSANFPTVRHAIPMLSVENTYSEEDLREFDARVRRRLEAELGAVPPFRYLVDPKIDGVALSLRYEQGRLAHAVTRGDGEFGDDITANARAIRSIPLTLAEGDWPAVLEVRGEVYWPRAEFDQVNERRIAAGDEPFKNPRNATAGTLKQLEPGIVAERNLRFCAHGLGEIAPLLPIPTASQWFSRLRAWGVPTSPAAQLFESIDAVAEFVRFWDGQRSTLAYETDGLVIKVDELALRERLGSNSKAPRWCIAYKYAAQRAETQLLKVDYQVGKLGTITPRAVMAPVLLAGTTVRHATLHNFDQVARLDLHLGDAVLIEKAGEIIPQVIAVLKEKRPPDAVPVLRPKRCPECNGEVQQDEGGVYLRCINPECPAQLIERLRYFCGRDQMDIQGVGDVLVERLVESGLVRSFADIFLLPQRRDALVDLTLVPATPERKAVKLGEKKTAALLAGIEAARHRPLARLLAALNIRHVGVSTAEDLAEHFGSMDALAAASFDELQRVEGIGAEVAASVRRWFESAAGQHTIDALRAAGVQLTQPQRARAAGAGVLAGKTLVVTGTLEKYDRKQIEELIKQHGGKVSGSVSRKTHYVVVGEDAGSKLAKARELGVPTLTEQEFDRLLQGQS